MDDALERSLLSAARRAATHAYNPYSGFAVGAAVAGRDGRLHAGCNVENASFGLTCCAERNALFTAVAEGQGAGDLVAMVVYVGKEQPSTSCGACRQVMIELMDDEAIVACRCEGDEVRRYRVRELLPDAFRLDRPEE